MKLVLPKMLISPSGISMYALRVVIDTLFSEECDIVYVLIESTESVGYILKTLVLYGK